MDVALARTRFDLWATSLLLGYASVATGLVVGAVALLDGTALQVVLVGLVLVWLVHSGLYAFTWVRMRRVDHPLGLHGEALHARSAFGELVVPWEAISSVRIERAWNGRRLRIRLVPPGDPRRGQLVAHVPPRLLRTVDEHGMRYSLRVLDLEPDRLREAFVVQSGGRVQVT